MSDECSWLLVEAISLAQEEGKTLNDFLQEVTTEWSDCLEGRKIEGLIRQGHSLNEAVTIVRGNDHHLVSPSP